MSNSKFRNPFSPVSRSPERVLSPDLKEALIKEVGSLAKDSVQQELRAAVVQLANNSAKFFSNFKTTEDVRWDECHPFLRNVPPSLDLKLIVGLPRVSDYEKTLAEFLPLVNNLAQVSKILDQIDGDYPNLEESDPLYDLSVRATVLAEISHKYSRYFYQQIREAVTREEKVVNLKAVEEKLLRVRFPKHLQTMSLDWKLSPSIGKKNQLKKELSCFFDHFDQLSLQYRKMQQDLFHSYNDFVNYGPEVLPDEVAVRDDPRLFFRKSLFSVVRDSVRSLMARVRDNYDIMVPALTAEGREVTYNDRVEDHLQGILENISNLEVEKPKLTVEQPIASSDCLTVADESLITYQNLVTRQIDDLQSADLKHMFCYEDQEVDKETLAGSDLFVDSLFNLESITKLSYDQLNSAEGVVQKYLSCSGLNYNFQSVASLLDSISSLKQMWSIAQGHAQKSRLLLNSFQKKSSVNDNAQRSVLSRCSLPPFPSNGARSPLDYSDWRTEFCSLIKSVNDPGQKMRLLRQSLETHKFARSLVRFCKDEQTALKKLDNEFAQKSSLGIRIAKEIHQIGLAQENLSQESRNIRKFLDLAAQLDFNEVPVAETIGVSGILHVCNSLINAHEAEYIARRTSKMHDVLSISDQMQDFIEYLEGLLKQNTAILQSRSLRAVLSNESNDKGPSKHGGGGYNQQPNKNRDLPQRFNKDQKVLSNQNNNFEKKVHKNQRSNDKGPAKGKENKSCEFCNLDGHNQFGKCKEIMSRLLDQTALLKEVQKRNLCLSCLHRVNNDGNTHNCRDSFKIKDKDGKIVEKSVYCKKYCRGPNNVRLHSRICGCASKEYKESLKSLQNKAILLRPKLRSSASHSLHHQSMQCVPSSPVVGGDVVVGVRSAGETHDDRESGSFAVESSAGPESLVNVGDGRLLSAEMNLTNGGTDSDGEEEVGNLINGSSIGECCRLSQFVDLTNDRKTRRVGMLFDSGSTNTVSSPEESDLATKSWVLEERFDLITQGNSQELTLTRDQFSLTNGFSFQAVRMPGSDEEVSFRIIYIPLKFQQEYNMCARYSVQTSGHGIVAGQDLAMSFPEILAVDSQTGVGVFRSRIDGQILPFTTGRESNYCLNERSQNGRNESVRPGPSPPPPPCPKHPTYHK